LEAVIRRFEASSLAGDLVRLPPRAATDDELALVHDRRYIELVKREIAQGQTELSTGDVNVNRFSEEAARLAGGLAISAVEAVFAGDVQNAFCAVRPPGHHATPTRGMGFCLFNTVALAARIAQTRHGAERVVIADWDVHHGNGTQDIFYRDGSVLFFSTHQSPWYPGTGAANEQGEEGGEGKTINCPLPSGTGREEIFAAFRGKLVPALENFHPDLVLISAGFDSRIGDPLGQFRLTDADFAELTLQMMDAADRFCNGRLVSVLEGGYNLEGLASAAEAHVRALTGQA
jgi:acetoin utilization deacetylase AcuC-like enzyme